MMAWLAFNNLLAMPHCSSICLKRVKKVAADSSAVAPATPAIGADGTVYVGTGGGDQSAYALDPASGHYNWNFAQVNFRIQSGMLVTPDNPVYFGDSRQYFYALNSDGTVKWTYDSSSLGGQGLVVAPPVIGTGGTLYYFTINGLLMAIDP